MAEALRTAKGRVEAEQARQSQRPSNWQREPIVQAMQQDGCEVSERLQTKAVAKFWSMAFPSSAHRWNSVRPGAAVSPIK